MRGTGLHAHGIGHYETFHLDPNAVAAKHERHQRVKACYAPILRPAPPSFSLLSFPIPLSSRNLWQERRLGLDYRLCQMPRRRR